MVQLCVYSNFIKAHIKSSFMFMNNLNSYCLLVRMFGGCSVRALDPVSVVCVNAVRGVTSAVFTVAALLGPSGASADLTEK